MNTVVLVFIVLIIGLLGYFIALYSQILSLRDHFIKAFVSLNFQLKQRYSLIPYLLQTTTSYISDESDAIQSLSQACERATNAAEIADTNPADAQLLDRLTDAEAALKVALGHFSDFIETSPNLKSDSRLVLQMNEISLVEVKISTSGQAFNDAVVAYNHYCERFPHSLITRIFRLRQTRFFN